MVLVCRLAECLAEDWLAGSPALLVRKCVRWKSRASHGFHAEHATLLLSGIKTLPTHFFFFSFVKFCLLLLLLTAKKIDVIGYLVFLHLFGGVFYTSHTYIFFTIFPTFLYFFLLKSLKPRIKEMKQNSILVLFCFFITAVLHFVVWTDVNYASWKCVAVHVERSQCFQSNVWLVSPVCL